MKGLGQIGRGGGLLAVAFACMALLLMTWSPPPAEASIVREVVTISMDAGTSTSHSTLLGVDGTIVSAYLVVPTVTSTTKTVYLSAACGATVGDVDIATTSTTSTGTVKLTALADTAVAGDVKAYIKTSQNEASTRTFYLLVFYDR